jgi:hypothetical protein
MPNWELTLVILGSVLVGALVPLIAMMAIGVHRAGKSITEIGERLRPTLAQVELISDRVEVLSRGLKGGEANVADLLASVGHVASGLEHNMKLINTTSAIVAAVGTAIATFLNARSPGTNGEANARGADGVGDNGSVRSQPASSHTPNIGGAD